MQNARHFRTLVEQENIESSYEKLEKISEHLAEECFKFSSNPFQTYVAASIVNKAKAMQLVPVSLPTGSGKTFVAVLLARFYLDQEEKPAIVTSTTMLAQQTKRMLGEALLDIPVLTMEEALYSHAAYNVFVVDEADESILMRGSVVDKAQKIVHGFWDMF